jgi:hypothetical protein
MPAQMTAQLDKPPTTQVTTHPAGAGLDHQLAEVSVQAGAIRQRPQVRVHGRVVTVNRRRCGTRHDGALYCN